MKKETSSSVKEALFTITDEQLETGMRGFPVGYCITSHVEPEKGLFYEGIAVQDLSHLEPEEVIYLLYFGKKGKKDEIKKFSKTLKENAACSKELIQAIERLPKTGHPMKLFSIALLLCGMLEGQNDYQKDCLNVIAKIPEITAKVIRHHAGWGSLPSPKPELGYIENFVHLLDPPNINKKEFTEVMKKFNILHYDHGGGNLSCFVGKAIASGLEDMYGSLSGAMCALAGPRHGKANQDSLAFLESLAKDMGKNPKPEKVRSWLQEKLNQGSVIYGFGHAVLRVEDPRATIFYDMAKNMHAEHPLVQLALILREEGKKLLNEQHKVSDPYPNVDAISGTLLTSVGFRFPEYFTLLFGMARCVGIAVQIVYERCFAKNGKGLPIIRPKYYYRKRDYDHT